jgi:hypothetical protein
MKKRLLTMLATIICLSASAQINQGTVMISTETNLNFTSAESDGESSDIFSLKGGVGYFVAENFAVGPVFSFEKEGDATSTGFGVFGRYYVNGKVFFGAGYVTNRVKFEVEPFGEFKATVNMVPLEAGYAAFITPNVAVEPSISYTVISGDGDGSAFGINVGFGIYLNRQE